MAAIAYLPLLLSVIVRQVDTEPKVIAAILARAKKVRHLTVSLSRCLAVSLSRYTPLQSGLLSYPVDTRCLVLPPGQFPQQPA